MMVGKCKLCGKDNVDLAESHIISEFIYRATYDSKHRGIDVPANPDGRAEIIQKGARENLLCLDCENLLSKYENKLRDFLNEVITNDNNTITRCYDKFKRMEKINYNDVKIALLSILYRMSVSKLEQFKGYSLGPKEKIIKDIILNNKYTDEYTFSIHVKPITMAGNYSPDQISPYQKKIKYKEIYTYNSFIIYGILFNIMLSNVPHDDTWHKFNMKENGTVILCDIDVREVGIGEDILDRFRNDNLKSLIKKLK